MHNNTLYVLYDLQVSPVSNEIFSFLILAELCNQKRNLGNLTIVIVPGSLDRFHDDDAPYPTNNKSWHQKILTSVFVLLPLLVTPIIGRSRETDLSTL